MALSVYQDEPTLLSAKLSYTVEAFSYPSGCPNLQAYLRFRFEIVLEISVIWSVPKNFFSSFESVFRTSKWPEARQGGGRLNWLI